MNPLLRIHSRFEVVHIGEDREMNADVPKKRPNKFYALLISIVLLVLALIATLVVGLLVISSCEGNRGVASGQYTVASPQHENRVLFGEMWSQNDSGESMPSTPDFVAPPLKEEDKIEIVDIYGGKFNGILVTQEP